MCQVLTSCSSTGTTHSFSEEEKLAFCDWINYQLEEDADLKTHLPIAEDGDALFKALFDGLILWYEHKNSTLPVGFQNQFSP